MLIFNSLKPYCFIAHKVEDHSNTAKDVGDIIFYPKKMFSHGGIQPMKHAFHSTYARNQDI